jgi:hypothetical protein
MCDQREACGSYSQAYIWNRTCDRRHMRAHELPPRHCHAEAGHESGARGGGGLDVGAHMLVKTNSIWLRILSLPVPTNLEQPTRQAAVSTACDHVAAIMSMLGASGSAFIE